MARMLPNIGLEQAMRFSSANGCCANAHIAGSTM